jgi:hypothetical protein
VLLFLSQALPNHQVVDYPSFKLVIVGDGRQTSPLGHGTSPQELPEVWSWPPKPPTFQPSFALSHPHPADAS